MDNVLLHDDGAAPEPWLVLVVDDDPEVHSVTRLCYSDFTHEGRTVRMISAHSASEARALLKGQAGVALVLLDVVMETESAGLDLARWIREELNNRAVRIVLRTGQPGQAPPRDVVSQYEIDDYRTKTEMTYERLHVLTVTALRTYRLLREQESRERQLAQYSDELERFAHAASHDLQTPLRTIVRFAQRLQDNYQAVLAGDGLEYVSYVVQGTRDLQRLIEGLLDYTSVGRSSAPLESVALNDAVRAASAALSTEIELRRARIDCGALPTVPGHREQLEEMFRQLIDNAIKFQPGASPVVSVAATAAGENWEVRISDRGIGIEQRHLERIFEPYGRLNRPEEYPGSGIGLAICRKIAQLHGGSLRAQSVAGTGTTIVVTLPRGGENQKG